MDTPKVSFGYFCAEKFPEVGMLVRYRGRLAVVEKVEKPTSPMWATQYSTLRFRCRQPDHSSLSHRSMLVLICDVSNTQRWRYKI